eukprot:15467456-Alexandrium_andersonii.AAC.1
MRRVSLACKMFHYQPVAFQRVHHPHPTPMDKLQHSEWPAVHPRGCGQHAWCFATCHPQAALSA